ncbi:hypothetical protein [Flavisolibacter tropicus]|uniref:Lipoprotein n=1 Tax=Flavisolibacter tropicus TaxID=1492898 RepID=A0A172TTW1_9BACT|nr:hypothetical protein [Flavisolibacter tropicus]ANE50213.1 hypothetical protein SY85_06545 [Flavisolibacter tropicus]
MKNVILVTGLLSIGIFSCTSNENKPPKAESGTVTKTTLIAADTTLKSEEPATKENLFMKDEALGPLSFGADMFYTNKILGPADSESEAEIWGTDGVEHKTLTYENGIVIDMVSKDDNYTINSVKVTSSSDLATRKGIKIGSTLNEVLAAYNKNIERPIADSSKIIAGSIYGGLVFTMEKGKVASIFLGQSAE